MENYITIRRRGGKNRGALLLELLIVISLLAVILFFGANALLLSMRSNKISGERNIANTLATESIDAVRAIVEENWQNIYGLTKSTQYYYPKQSLGKWILTTTQTDGDITVNNTVFTRYAVVENVCRGNTSRDVTGVAPCADSFTQSDDPSTQKVTVTVSWPGGSPIVIHEYFFRWKNKICPQGGQGAWATPAPGNAVQSCAGATYDSKDSSIDTTGGSLKLQ